MVRLAREEAQLLADDTGLSRYDALMDRYEPGMRAADIDRIFGDVRQWLPDLVARAQARQRDETVIAPAGPVSGRGAARAESRRDEAAAASTSRPGGSTRARTRSAAACPRTCASPRATASDDFAQSLMGTIHETGHARFEQNLPRAWLGQPIGVARSYGIHESQSLSFEMQLARSRPFVGLLAPLLAAHFGAQPAFEPDNLYRLLTRVQARDSSA